jgi:hypothetical protein
MSNKYDFSDLGTPQNNDDLKDRPNFRIVKTCGNCKYFMSFTRIKKHGNCGVTNMKLKKINKSRKECYDDSIRNQIKSDWPKCHATTVCENHLLRSRSYNIAMVSEWCDVEFGVDGMVRED